MSIEHENFVMEKESEWMQGQKDISRILESGMEEFTNQIERVEKAFEVGEHTLCCMDEGTPMGDMRSAGAGILTQGEDRTFFIQTLKHAGVMEVKSHTGCGAAALFREQYGMTDKTIDEVAIEQAKKIAEELGVKYGGHITELKRPKFHNAQVVYVDGTGRFNPSKAEGLPQGFVVSRRYMTTDQSLSETELASKIAFGDHGFGKKFDASHPLTIVAVGEADEEKFSVDVIALELQEMLETIQKNRPEDAARIQIRTWRAPAQTVTKVWREAA